MITKVVQIGDECIQFENGYKLYSEHRQDCCENHYLNINDISIEDFEGLQFDLSGDSFFKRIDGYGIELVPISGHSVRISGHGSNNGYYSENLTLVIEDEKGSVVKRFDITECQEINY